MPYALIDFPTFKSNLIEQLQMSKDPYVFPFTLQYVGTKPYLYPLQQIFLWGLGPIFSTFAFLGILIGVVPKIRTTPKKGSTPNWLIVFSFASVFFLLMGQSAVKFMRYYLPLYPLLTILAAYFVDTFTGRIKHVLGQYFAKVSLVIIILVTFIWPLSFINIYSKPNTRVTASDWINQNIKEGSVLAVEHWDDRLPISGSEKFSFVEMPMYDPDSDDSKWEKINNNLKKADYIILASNRLYTPLQKLTDCPKIKHAWRCYPKTDKYYRDLLSGNLGFIKAAQFTNYPYLSIMNYKLSINDGAADENFTVFDHPKILIFKKI